MVIPDSGLCVPLFFPGVLGHSSKLHLAHPESRARWLGPGLPAGRRAEDGVRCSQKGGDGEERARAYGAEKQISHKFKVRPLLPQGSSLPLAFPA